MGSSLAVNTTTNNINNSIKNTLKQNTSASATAICQQELKLVVQEFNNCTMTVENFCSATAKATAQMTAKAVSDAMNGLSTQNKQDAAQALSATIGINTTSNNVSSDLQNYLEQNCNSNAFSYAGATYDMTIGKCIGPAGQPPVVIKVLNTGSADATCVTTLVADIAAQISNVVATSNAQESWLGSLLQVGLIVMGFVFGAPIVLITAYYLVRMMKRPYGELVLINMSQKEVIPPELGVIMMHKELGY